MAKTITVYSTNTCASCRQLKQWLNAKGLPFQEINLDEQPELRQQVIEMSGAMTVPVTVVEDETGKKDITVGPNLSKIASAVA